MKLLSLGLALTLVGCAHQSQTYQPQSYQPRAISYEQLKTIRVSNTDCYRIDNMINYVELQLRLRGIADKNPEDLSKEDMQYNATAKIIIWSLRIGCSNPNRYVK